uniref:histone acetyltransferase n=2 Tax=Aegilops tauschii subsp. strangulata TaxID=200361 RepID=A0A453PDN7_AEGTS
MKRGMKATCSIKKFLCKVDKLYFEPPPIYCCPCVARTKQNASYYTAAATEICHNFCILCYNETRSCTIQVERWVMCDKCERWKHQICALFNFKRGDSKEAKMYLP